MSSPELLEIGRIRVCDVGGNKGCLDISKTLKLLRTQVAACSIPLYAALPAINEWIVERGYTLAYSRISDVGIARYLAYFVLYMVSIEFCVYWQHRNLHDVKIGYK